MLMENNMVIGKSIGIMVNYVIKVIMTWERK
jgi:hypothetical protein